VKPFFETVTPEPGASWAFLDRRLPNGIPFQWHHHPEYELTLTLNSRGHRYVGDDVGAYDDGDLVLIGPGIPHSWHSREAIDPGKPHVALVAWFTREWVSQLTTVFPETAHLTGMLARATQGLFFDRRTSKVIAPLFEEIRTAPPARRLVLLIEVLTTLCQHHDAVPLANAPRDGAAVAADPRMIRVFDHLHAHFAHTIAVGTLAQIACVSASTFHRMFKRHTRMTMVDYVTRLRIGRACSLLIETAQSVATIAADVGYTNLSLFNRQFARAKSATPSMFRRQHRVMLGNAAQSVCSAPLTQIDARNRRPVALRLDDERTHQSRLSPGNKVRVSPLLR
jgi:AraC-like DNA-binding protein